MKVLASALLAWHKKHGRHDLPWQIDNSPYHTWVSEIMLQQTQVSTVIPYYLKFIETFPCIEALAKASLDKVNSLWSGLGYYNRAKNLHQSAKKIVNEHQGRFPKDLESLYQLPGVGKTTAHAIYALSFNKKAAILDGNAKRVLARFYKVSGQPNQASTLNRLWQLAEDTMPNTNCSAYTQAIMDLGATICKRSSPLCQKCPLSKNCQAYTDDVIQHYPEKKKAIIKQKKASTLVCVLKDNTIYLEKRPANGIWANLFALPEFSSKKALSDFLHQFHWQDKKIHTPFKHIFTHIELMITPMILTIKNDESFPFSKNGRFVPIDTSLTLGLPKPIRQIINNLLVF